MWRFAFYVAAMFAAAALVTWGLWASTLEPPRQICTRWVWFDGPGGGFDAECLRWEQVQ